MNIIRSASFLLPKIRKCISSPTSLQIGRTRKCTGVYVLYGVPFYLEWMRGGHNLCNDYSVSRIAMSVDLRLSSKIMFYSFLYSQLGNFFSITQFGCPSTNEVVLNKIFTRQFEEIGIRALKIYFQFERKRIIFLFQLWKQERHGRTVSRDSQSVLSFNANFQSKYCFIGYTFRVTYGSLQRPSINIGNILLPFDWIN